MEEFVGFYALLLIPGFIWVQVYEHYLLREKKEQFVKTLEIVLWSAIIWAIVLCLPFTGSYIIKDYLKVSASGKNGLPTLVAHSNELLIFFGVVWIETLLMANLWAWMRRVKRSDNAFMWLTGREWYPTTSQKFYSENIGKSVSVILKTKTYAGTLRSAPDTAADGHIILEEPSQFHDGIIHQLPMNPQLLIKIEDIVEIRSVIHPPAPPATPPSLPPELPSTSPVDEPTSS